MVAHPLHEWDDMARWGAVRKLPSGRYQASYMVNGERFPADTTFSTQDAAEAWLRGVRTDIERGVWRNPRIVAQEAAEADLKAEAEKFGDYARTWVEQRVSSKGRPLALKTRREYERQLRVGLSRFSRDRIPAITPARVRAWHAERSKDGPTQAGAEARLLRAILNTAIIDGIIDSNPVPSALTRTTSGRKHRPPTFDELAAILEAMPSHMRLAVLLAAYGGMRLSEWRALRRSDLTLVEGRILVSVTRQAQYIAGDGWLVTPPKSEEGVRVIPLPKWMTEAVQDHLRNEVGQFPESLLFAPVKRSEFMHDRQFNRYWNPARDAAGVRDVVREHDLRAFAGTTHAQSGATLRETMKFLGHSTTIAAMAYQHAAEERMLELADRMPAPPTTPKRVKSLGQSA